MKREINIYYYNVVVHVHIFFRLTFNIQGYGPLNDWKYRTFVVKLFPEPFLSNCCMELNETWNKYLLLYCGDATAIFFQIDF